MQGTEARKLTLKGWQDGTHGLRVGAESRRRVFEPLRRTLRQVHLELPGLPRPVLCRITPTSWMNCPDLRSAEVGRWMKARGDMPWPQGTPPRYMAELVGVEDGTAVVRVVE